MNRYALLFCGLALLAPSAPARADHPGGATRRDLRLLQDDLQNLDDTLATLDTRDARTAEFRRREQRIQTDVVRLRDEMELHRQDRDEGFGASKAAVDDLRQRIQGLENDVNRSYAGRYPSGERRLGEGTRMHVRLEEPLSSRTARVEDRVEATVDYPVRDASGRIAIPAGSRVVGTVTNVTRSDRSREGGAISMAFNAVYVGNQRMDLRGRVVSLEDEGDDRAKRAGVGAALGGLLGGILGGKKGALLGIVIGGGGGVVSSHGGDVDLPAGTVLTLQLDRPLMARRY